MKPKARADLSRSLDELDDVRSVDPIDAPTSLVSDVIRSRRKPLRELEAFEIGQLVVQMEGVPWILDLVFPLLRRDPLFDGGYYPGDVLSNLIRADEDTWRDRPDYRQELAGLYRTALDRPFEENDIFIESLASLSRERMRELSLFPPVTN